MLRLRVIRPGAAPQLVNVRDDVAVVGRSPDCDVVIDDVEVSRRHARILRGTVVMDLASRNGTWIDENRVSEPSLTDGKRLRLGTGDRAIEIVLDEAARGEPAELDARLEIMRLIQRLEAIERQNQALRQQVAELEAQAKKSPG